jgi:hypothetical protein
MYFNEERRHARGKARAKAGSCGISETEVKEEELP